MPNRLKLLLRNRVITPPLVRASLAFQTASDTHYFQMANGPALPNADWCIVMRQRFVSNAAEACHLSAFAPGGDVFSPGSFLISAVQGNPDPTNFCLMTGTAGELIPLDTANAAHDTPVNGDYLMVIQRRGVTYQTGWIPRNTATPELKTAAPTNAWTAMPTRRWDIGRRFFFDSTPSPHTYSELGVLVNDSLSLAEITSLSNGASLADIRSLGNIEALLRFYGNNATEQDVTGHGHDAVRTGTGFAVGPAIF